MVGKPLREPARRELRNVIERTLILYADAEELRPEHLPASIGEPPAEPSLPLDAMEKRMIADALRKANGNQSQAARLLGVTRDTLRYRLKKRGFE